MRQCGWVPACHIRQNILHQISELSHHRSHHLKDLWMPFNFAHQEGTNKQIRHIRKSWRSNQPVNPIPRIQSPHLPSLFQGMPSFRNLMRGQNRQIQDATMQIAFSPLAIPWNPKIYRVLKTVQEKSCQISKAPGSQESVFPQPGPLPAFTMACKSPIEKCHQTMGGQPSTNYCIRIFMPHR